MNHSDSIKELGAALIAVQAEIVPMKKDKENPYFHSKYVGLDTVMPAALELLNKHGLAVTQMVDNGVDSGSLTTMLIHSSGEWLSATQPLLLAQASPQGQGSAITYARRYSIMSMLGIVAEEDDDANAASAPKRTPPPFVEREARPPAQQYAESGRQMAQEYADKPQATQHKKANTKYDGKCYVCGDPYFEGDEVYYKQIEGKWVRWHLACEAE